MDKYRVMLVDDEEEVRRAIVRKLNWAELGFEVVGEAANGEEALELCETVQPDVIMTDIKMPFMDGLTLCRKAKQLLPGVKVAIFSGFDEFEYAKEAIKLEVEEYILKPIDADELAGIFRRLRANLDEEIARSRDVARLQKHYEDSLPVMRQQLLSDLLDGRIEAAKIEGRLAEYGMQLAAERYCVAVVRYEQPADGAYAAPRLAGYSLEGVIKTHLAGAKYRLVQFYDHIVLLCMLDDGQSVRRVIARLNGLFPVARKLLGLHISIGIGTSCQGLAEVAASYTEARDALEYQPLVDSGQCIYIGDIEPDGPPELLDEGFMDELVRCIKVGSAEDLARSVQAAVGSLKAGPPSLAQYQAFMLGTAAELLRLIRAYRLDEGDAAPTAELLEKSTAHFGSLEEMAAWLEGYCEQLRTAVRRERKDTTRAMVETAREYLAEHYADEQLSVDTLCSVLNLSPAYFSTIFKKETGEGFVGYLTRLRMEKALEYLNTTDDKTYMIAEKVGYTDPNYFSYVFKKQYGISPSKYRADKAARV